MTTKDNKAPVRADDDGPELAAIAEQVRPVVDAGKGRALAFEVVCEMLVIFDRRALDRGTLFAEPIARFFEALDKWLGIALTIEDGRTSDLPSLTLLDVAGMADRIASAAWCQARTGQPFPFERAIVLDIATALRRACGCSDARAKAIADEAEALELYVNRWLASLPANRHEDKDRRNIIAACDALRAAKEAHDATANTLLPLLIRDARRLCAAATVDVAPIEAAIARHGGRPS